MRLKFIYPATILLAAVILTACNAVDTKVNSQSQKASKPAAGSDTVYADGAPRVTIEELDALLKDGKAVVIDVRNQAAYDLGHIPGARLIPAGEILNHLNELPRDKTIVTYCS